MMSDEQLKEQLKALDSLSDEEKRVAIEILRQVSTTGESDILTSLKYGDFAEIPVDIDTFLDNDLYLGRGIWAVDENTGERRCTLFPYWRETLKKIFPTNLTTAYNTLILTGAIGLGKTLMGVLAELYLLYRMLCLKDPYGYYGLMPSDKITFSMLNITLDTARGVGWDKLQQLVQGSDWFMNHGSVNASRTAPTWQPNNHIELVFGSSNNHVIGRALFSNLSDEVNFSGGNSKNVENQKKKLKKMIAQIDARMKSRFGKGTFLPTLNIIISSKDTEQSFLDGYIDTKRKNESTTTLIIDEPQWVVRNDKGTPDDPGAFYVAIGGKYLPHELLPKDATEELVNTYRSKGYEKIMKIPPIFREDFETNIDQALMDIAGLSSANTTKFLSGKRLNEAKTHDYSNPFTKDIIEVGNSPEDYAQYANFFDLSRLDPTDIAKPLFIHLDMSVSGDKTGIAGTVIEGKKPSVPGQEESLSLRYKLLFSTSIQAPKGYQISFEKTQNFIKWLRDRGFAIKMISADTYQSAPVLQELQSAGFKTQVLSVDRTNSDKICEPYQYLKSAIYEQRVKIYDKCDLLSEELVNLEKEASGKINHPENGKRGCFTGDTKISLVDGRKVALVDLVKEFNEGKINYVYSFNETTKKIEPKPIIKAWCTQKDASLIEVTLDSGEVIRCTPNHRFMLRDSTYREAKDLVENDSLMPLYTKYPSDCDLSDYRLYYEPMEDKWHYEHRQFATEVLDEKYLVHHKNCKPSDNTPTNLLWCSQAKHMELHKELSTGACSSEAIAKKSESLKEWYRDPENADIIEAKRQKLSKQRYEQLGWTEDDIQQHKLKIEQQHENGARLAAEAKQKAAEKAAYIKDIETTFNICWDSLSITEKNSYSVKYQRMQNPETQDKINAAVKENHKLGKYANADKALAECNLESKKLKELCPTVDYDKFIQMFGFDLRSLPGGPGSKRAPWITKYRKIICKEILNHKVKSVRYIDTKEDVYDLTIQDNHNFALAAGIFVHNSKDQADAFCGSLFMASKYAEEYAYNYGESWNAALEANETSDKSRKEQMIADFEAELRAFYKEQREERELIDQQRKEEYEYYQDISDGIIII